jgi:hypothetical protein
LPEEVAEWLVRDLLGDDSEDDVVGVRVVVDARRIRGGAFVDREIDDLLRIPVPAAVREGALIA